MALNYFVCESCTAKWFAPAEVMQCSRCGVRCMSDVQHAPPWKPEDSSLRPTFPDSEHRAEMKPGLATWLEFSPELFDQLSTLGLSEGVSTLLRTVAQQQQQTLELLRKIEKQLAPPSKPWYSIEELAERLGKAHYTLREWCRLGRLAAKKHGSGRGKYQSWVVSHEELLRYEREGLLPERSLAVRYSR